MKNLLGSLLAVLISLAANAQNFSYSFEGTLSSESKEALELKISTLNNIQTVKCRYKADSGRGELLLFVSPTPEGARGEADGEAYSPAQLKAILIEFGLSPLNYRTLND